MAYQETLERNVFLRCEIGGFPSLKVDTLVSTSSLGQHQIIVRTTDGLTLSLDCEPPSSTLSRADLLNALLMANKWENCRVIDFLITY